VEWTGAEGTKRPASVTTISNAATGRTGAPAWVAWAAFALAVVSLGLALRPSGRARPESAPSGF
jgi:hypothetical protein